MDLLTDDHVAERLSWDAALRALENAFRDRSGFLMPDRVALKAARGSYLVMPCADRGGWFGVKQVSVLPDNPGRDLPSVQAWYTLFDPDGAPTLACSATLLTRIRTAGVSALAARALAPVQARTLLVCGTGSLAPVMAEAHAQVRAYARVRVWGRDAGKAERTAQAIAGRLPDAEVTPAPDLETAVREADVVTAATTAQRPFLRGEWLRPGQHLDLVGAFLPDMAEADATAVKAADVFVDDLDAARTEAGDLIQAQAQGWSFDLVEGDLADVVAGRAGRQGPQRLTLFKSVGLALEDLAVARLMSSPSPS
jgi:alanine dehydrogenase